MEIFLNHRLDTIRNKLDTIIYQDKKEVLAFTVDVPEEHIKNMYFAVLENNTKAIAKILEMIPQENKKDVPL